jgi:signal transduction histidine kinase
VRAGELGRLSEPVEAAVYFCCLEALQNAAKHAAGSAVTITLERDGTARGEALHFAVEDDGTGFDPAAAGSGAGLQNMADRVGAIGGSVRLTSAPGRGTTVSGRVPLDADGAVLDAGARASTAEAVAAGTG